MRMISNFIRGSQLFEHDFAMFFVAFKWPAILAILSFVGVTWWMLATRLSDHDTYLVWMRLYGAGYMFLELPAKHVTIEDPLGRGHLVPVSVLEYYPPVAIAWLEFKGLIWSSLLRCMAGFMILGGGYAILSERYGNAAALVRHVRGALLVSAEELNAQIKRLNLAPHKQKLKAMFGYSYLLLGASQRLQALGIRAYRIAGIDYPQNSENRHTLIVGTTGSGKTQTLLEMVEQVREHGQKCVVFDLKGDFVSAFYDPTRDIILNPSDARCPAWSIFDECRTLSEFSTAAEALIPGDASLSDSFWVEGARTMFTNYCMECIAGGNTNNAALVDKLMTAPLEEIYAILKDTPAGVIVDKDTPRMGQSVRAVFNTNARGLQLLPSKGAHFSVRNWVNSPKQDGSIIFFSTRIIDMPLCRQLLTLWIDTALITLMSGKRSEATAMWFFVDELAALHKLPTLKQALETSRSYGGAIVLGCHSNSQIREIYGKDAEQTILGLTRTKLFLSAADEETAKYAAEVIGTEEVIDVQHGATIGLNSMRDARSLSHNRTNRQLKMPQEVKGLPSLSGYLTFPEGLPAAPVIIVPKSRPDIAEAFIERLIEPRKKRSDRTATKRRTGKTAQQKSAAAATHETGGADYDSKSGGTLNGATDATDDGESGYQNQTSPVRLGETAKRRPGRKGLGKASLLADANPGATQSGKYEPPLETPHARPSANRWQKVPKSNGQSRAVEAPSDLKAEGATGFAKRGTSMPSVLRDSGAKGRETQAPETNRPNSKGRPQKSAPLSKGPDELDFEQ
jgi:type IV conjugative transfer system coupling protein TraD